MVVRVVGCTRARPAEQAHHAGGLPIVGASGRVQLRGRAGVSAQQNSNDPVQQGPEGAVRGVLRTPGHLLAGHLQRAPADGLCLFTTTVKEEAMLQNCVALKNADNGNVTMEWLTRVR